MHRDVALLFSGIGVVTAAYFVIRGSRPSAVLIAIFAVIWAMMNGKVEGPTLVSFAPRHGLTTADLLSIGAAVLATWRLSVDWLRARRSAGAGARAVGAVPRARHAADRQAGDLDRSIDLGRRIDLDGERGVGTAESVAGAHRAEPDH